jgi:hypothetical protein
VSRTALRRGAGILAAVIALPIVVIGASAAIDHPARYYRSVLVADSPRRVVWDVLTDFGSYDEWNPYMVRASGRPIEGTTLKYRRVPVGEEADDVTATVLIVREKRKLEWQVRMVGPGVLDQEQIFRLVQLGPERVRIVTETRFEGVLAPFVDTDARREGLALMVRALARRAYDVYKSSSA